MANFYESVLEVLKQEERFFSTDGTLLRNTVYEAAMQMDVGLLHLLLSNEDTKKAFFKDVDGISVFDKVRFGWVINNRQFLPDSYTRFQNKIGLADENGDMFSSTGHVETCVLLSHKSADDFISVKMEYADDRKIQPDRITYRLIQEYIEEKYGFKVHTANIAEVKRNLGLPMYDAPNAVEELKRPYKPAPEYKVEAIKDALRHFKVID